MEARAQAAEPPPLPNLGDLHAQKFAAGNIYGAEREAEKARVDAADAAAAAAEADDAHGDLLDAALFRAEGEEPVGLADLDAASGVAPTAWAAGAAVDAADAERRRAAEAETALADLHSWLEDDAALAGVEEAKGDVEIAL